MTRTSARLRAAAASSSPSPSPSPARAPAKATADASRAAGRPTKRARTAAPAQQSAAAIKDANDAATSPVGFESAAVDGADDGTQARGDKASGDHAAGGHAAGDSAANGEPPRYFLMKAEPEPRMERGVDVSFSIDSLAALFPRGEPWDGVRNMEAAKTMRAAMQIGDRAFFYHSNCPNPGIAGVMRVAKAGYVDDSAFNKDHPYYDEKSVREKPKWYRVDVVYERHLRRFIGLKELRTYQQDQLKDMALLRRPQLSVQRVKQTEWDFVMQLEQQDAP